MRWGREGDTTDTAPQPCPPLSPSTPPLPPTPPYPYLSCSHACRPHHEAHAVRTREPGHGARHLVPVDVSLHLLGACVNLGGGGREAGGGGKSAAAAYVTCRILARPPTPLPPRAGPYVTCRILARPSVSGSGMYMIRSKRPGRTSALSMAPGRLVAPSTTMPRLSSKPSIWTWGGGWKQGAGLSSKPSIWTWGGGVEAGGRVVLKAIHLCCGVLWCVVWCGVWGLAHSDTYYQAH